MILHRLIIIYDALEIYSKYRFRFREIYENFQFRDVKCTRLQQTIRSWLGVNWDLKTKINFYRVIEICFFCRKEFSIFR